MHRCSAFDTLIARFGSIDTSGEHRIDLYLSSLPMLLDHWLTGIGFGSYSLLSPVYLKGFPEHIHYDKAHNEYLELLIELGIPVALLLFGWMLSGMVKLMLGLLSVMKNTKIDQKRVVLGTAAFCGLVGFLVHGLVDFGWRLPANLVYSVTLLALCAESIKAAPLPIDQPKTDSDSQITAKLYRRKMAVQIKDFIDIHCHILPGLDDGAKDMAESLEIARCYERTGIKKVIATPHFLPGTAWAAEKEIVKQSVQELQASLDRNNIDLQVLPGMEIAFHKRLEERMRTNSFLPLGESGYYLIEPSFHGEQDSLLENLKSLLKMGQKLILAHPERIDRLHNRLDVLKAWSNRACLSR